MRKAQEKGFQNLPTLGSCEESEQMPGSPLNPAKQNKTKHEPFLLERERKEEKENKSHM